MCEEADSYMALYSMHPTEWSVANDYELICNFQDNVWIVEMGDVKNNGTFESFKQGLLNAQINVVDNFVTYNSPSQGLVEVGRTGPMMVSGKSIDLGPFERWDNKYSKQDFGLNKTVIDFGKKRLVLDFETPKRKYMEKMTSLNK
jgi:hypothetical protein